MSLQSSVQNIHACDGNGMVQIWHFSTNQMSGE